MLKAIRDKLHIYLKAVFDVSSTGIYCDDLGLLGRDTDATVDLDHSIFLYLLTRSKSGRREFGPEQEKPDRIVFAPGFPGEDGGLRPASRRRDRRDGCGQALILGVPGVFPDTDRLAGPSRFDGRFRRLGI